jgi:hypothetical protein
MAVGATGPRPEEPVVHDWTTVVYDYLRMLENPAVEFKTATRPWLLPRLVEPAVGQSLSSRETGRVLCVADYRSAVGACDASPPQPKSLRVDRIIGLPASSLGTSGSANACQPASKPNFVAWLAGS